MKQLKYFDEFCKETNLSKSTLSTYKFVLGKLSKNNMDEIDFIKQSKEEMIYFIMNKLNVRSYTIDIIEKRLSAIRRYYAYLYEKNYITDEQITKLNEVCTDKEDFSKLIIEKQKENISYPLPSDVFNILKRIDNDAALLNNNYYHVLIELIFSGINDESFESFYNLKKSDVHVAGGFIDVKTHNEEYPLYVGKELCERLLAVSKMKYWETWSNIQKQDSKRMFVMSMRDDYVFKFTTFTDNSDLKKTNRIFIRRIGEIDSRYNLKSQGIEFKSSRIFYSGLYYRVTKKALEQELDIHSIGIPRYTTEESQKCRDILISEMKRVHLHKNVTPVKKNYLPIIDAFTNDIKNMEE